LQAKLGHPEVIHYQCLALWSINERLSGRDGVDLPPFNTLEVIQDAVNVLIARSETKGKSDDLEEVLDDMGVI